MLSLIKLIVKWTILSWVIPTLGNWVHWDGKSISELVRVKMAPYEKRFSLTDLQNWAKGITHDAQRGFQDRLTSTAAAPRQKADEDDTTLSERQKLRTLIHELSSSDTTQD